MRRPFVLVLVACAVLAPAVAAPGHAGAAAADRWAAWVAPRSQCRGGESTVAPARAQVRAMLCLVNFARRKHGAPPLVLSARLTAASAEKALDIVRCGVFEHGPCGEDPAARARSAGYHGAWGENLFFGTRRYGAPRRAMLAWLRSPGHRKTLLYPGWRTIGIARRGPATIGSIRRAVIWVNQFGDASAADPSSY